MSLASALYAGDVVHVRYRPRHHRLHYRVFALLLDFDELPALDRIPLFGHNRTAVLSFHDADHGDGASGGLRGWVERQLALAGLEFGRPTIRVLCYPRLFGYVFNPLTVYFVSDAEGVVRALLHEVTNTFGERRTYVIPVTDPPGAPIRQTCAKQLYVSPFVPMDVRYDFLVRPPAERILVRVDDVDDAGLLLRASFSGRRRELNGKTLLGALLRYPLMTLKVIVGIHWEALRLWRKGAPVFGHAAAPQRIATTVVVPAGTASGTAAADHAARDREPEAMGHHAQ
jgi:DUF1365 family protein